MVEINISQESRDVEDWVNAWTPAERAAQYEVLFDIAMSPQYEEIKHEIAILRYGLHGDWEAKRYIANHPEQFGTFKLDYYTLLEHATEYNFALGQKYDPEKWTDEAIAQAEADMAVSRRWLGTRSGMTANEMVAPETEPGPLGRRVAEPSAVPDGLMIPIDQFEYDLRGYMPMEEELGWDFWPLMLGISALTAGWFALPAGAVGGAVAAGMAAAANGAAVATRWMPAGTANEMGKWTLDNRVWATGSTAIRAAAVAAATNASLDIARNIYDPEGAQRNEEQVIEAANEQLRENGTPVVVDSETSPVSDAWIASLAERSAQATSFVLTGEGLPEGTDPQNYVEAVNAQASTIMAESSVYPNDIIETETRVAGNRMPTMDGTGQRTVQGVLSPEAEDFYTTAFAYDDAAIAWAETQPEWGALVVNFGKDYALQWALTNYNPNYDEEVEIAPSPYVGAGVEGSPINRPTQDPNTGQWSNDSYRVARQDRPGFNQGGPWEEEARQPVTPRYDQNDFSNITGNMTPGQIESFVEKGIAAGIINEDYIGTGLMDGVITSAMEYTMYQANLSGDTWGTVLDKLVEAYAEAQEQAKKDRLNEWYNNFVPSTPFFDLDPDTIAQAVKTTMREEMGREPNQWEIDAMADGMRTDRRASYDRQIAAERDVWNAKGRAEEYDDPQTLPTSYEQVDETASFNERFEDRYKVEIDQHKRHEDIEEDTTNLFSGLSQLSRLGGGI